MSKYTKKEIESHIDHMVPGSRSHGMLAQMLELVPEDPAHPVEEGLYWAYRRGEKVLIHLFSSHVYGVKKWSYKVVYFTEGDRTAVGTIHILDGSNCIDEWSPRVEESWEPTVSEEEEVEEPSVLKTPEMYILEFLAAIKPDMYARDVGNDKVICVQDVRMHNTFGQTILEGCDSDGDRISYMVETDKLNTRFKSCTPTLGSDHP
jgi:hypothetical protein